MHTLINQLAEELANGIRPAIPLSIDLWNYEMITAYLKKSPQQVRQRYAALPGFPKLSGSDLVARKKAIRYGRLRKLLRG